MIVNFLKFNTGNISIKPNSNKVLVFRGSSNPLKIQDRYLSSESKNKTVTILGCAKDADYVKDYSQKAYDISQELVRRGYNILTGCGNKGIMGAAYKGALSAEKVKEHPEQNLAFIRTPRWGDEDTENCKVIGKPAPSETERLENGFAKASNNFIVFPGGVWVIPEVTALIAKNKTRPVGSPTLNIMLVDKNFFKSLKEQYQYLYKVGLMRTKPETLFKVVEPEDVLKEFPDLNQSEKKFEATA